MLRTRLLPFAWGFGGALVGSVAILLLVHLWSDHVALHTMLEYLNRVSPTINALPVTGK